MIKMNTIYRFEPIYLIILCFMIEFVFSDKLVLVQMLMRHGDRSPVQEYPNDNNTWPQGLGQLTKLGIEQQYKVGEYLRKRYIDELKHLSPSYQWKELYVQSSDIDRTLMSVTSTLQGLYPDRQSALWDPIPVHTKQRQHDPMLIADLPCAKYDDEFNSVLRSEDGRKYFENNKPFIHDVCLAAGWKNASLSNVWNTYDSINIAIMQNKSVPWWVTPQVFKKLHEMYLQKMKFDFYTEDMIKITAGLFLTEILNKTKAKMDGEMADTKVLMYMSHDTKIISVLSALGLWDEEIPPLSSVLIFELYETPDNKHKIQILYKNNSVTDPMGDPVVLVLPGCTALCPLETFHEQVEPYFLKDEEAWTGFCQYWGQGQITKGGIVAVSIFCTLFLIGLIVLFFWCYRHQQAEVRYLPANYGANPAI